MRGYLRRKAKDYAVKVPELLAGIHTGLVRYTLQQLRIATNNFSSGNKIGKGGFGEVFRGEIDYRVVAVKRFVNRRRESSNAEFIAEINALSRIHHRNIISLIGFCISKDELLLVFDFAENNSLAYHLHESGKGERLDWRTRRKIALGTARALAYLHHDCEPRIIHRNIKPSTILLNSEFEAKVSSYHIAKLYPDSASHVTSMVMGTVGFLDPQYLVSGILTNKADVYAFGIMMLEMITGVKIYSEKFVEASHGHSSMTERLRKALKERTFDGLVGHPVLEDYDHDCVMRMVACAAVSICYKLDDRPTMKQIVRVLEGYDTPDNFLSRAEVSRLAYGQRTWGSPSASEQDNWGSSSASPSSINAYQDLEPMVETQISLPKDFVIHPTIYSIRQLETATNNFSPGKVIGRGGFATVYKGKLGGRTVAIKKFIDEGTKGDETFRIEFDAVSQVSHGNLISLVGYCTDGEARILVYEFAVNGSLKDQLMPEQKRYLDWETRKNIVLGTARGLAYLHHSCVPAIVHRDIKPENILLDSKFEAKVSDFGIAKRYPNAFTTHILTDIRGSPGYIDPHYVNSSILSSKSDVYSFGILLLGLITGHEPFKESEMWRSKLQAALIQEKFDDLVDEYLNNDYDTESMICMVACAAVSIFPTPQDRPTMQEIVNVLQGYRPPKAFIEKLLRKAKLHVRQEITVKTPAYEEVNDEPPFDGQDFDIPLSPTSQETSAPFGDQGEDGCYRMVNHTFGSLEVTSKMMPTSAQIKTPSILLEHGLDTKESKDKPNDVANLAMLLLLITDETTTKIGIYGNGGVGKTTMLKSLITNPKTARTFDLIVFVTVSRYWNVRKLQNEIARHLQLCIDELETESQIAAKLLRALNGLKFLLILDDVWDIIDLHAVGLPDPLKEMGCKIVIASRSWNVCQHMLADKKAEMEGISMEEARELFHKQLGGSIDFPEFQILAEAILEECGGSPLTVMVTARALRAEHDVQVWEHALEELSIQRKLGLHYTEGVLSQLKFSCDRLKVHEKNFFLYCALFPEDEEINTCQLIDCCLEEGLLVGNSGDLHKLGHGIVDRLIDAALLEVLDDGVSLKMHNTIRDLASWILSPNVEGCQFLLGTDLGVMRPTDEGSSSSSVPPIAKAFFFPGNSEILSRAATRHKQPLTEEEWRKAKMIYLMDSEVSVLPSSPISPNLVALFLQRNHLIRVIPTSFFDHMPSLQFLNLSKTRIKSLPPSFFNLLSLRALILRDCERFFVLPAEIGCLKNLEILDLQGTNIMNLPIQICELSHLKHFQVSFYGSNYQRECAKLPAELIPRNIISRLLALEKLGVVLFPGDQRWSKNIPSLIPEVAELAWLTSLTFGFPEVDLLKVFLQSSVAWRSKRIKRFNFVIGHDAERIVNRVSIDGESAYATQGQSLRYVNGEGVVPDTILEVLEDTTAFCLDHHLVIRRLSEIRTDKINKLKVCIVRECPMIQTVIESQDVTTDAVLPFLERLNIHYLWNLRRIWEGTIPTGSFVRLRILSLHACPKLDFVLSSSMLSYLCNLEELIVEDCPRLKEIIIEDEVMASPDKLVNLKQVTLHYLPELVSIWKGPWPLLERMSFYNCCSLKNIGLDSELKRTLKEIKAEKEWWDELHWDDTALFLHLQEACFVPISDEDVEGNTYCRCPLSNYS